MSFQGNKNSNEILDAAKLLGGENAGIQRPGQRQLKS
jgi:hypothetical protein